MTIRHLRDDELDLALAGETLPAEAAEHLAACLVCRRRRDAFLAAVDGARGADPDEATRRRVREGALAAWGGTRRRRHWVRWVAAAAAVVVLGLLPLLRGHTARAEVQRRRGPGRGGRGPGAGPAVRGGLRGRRQHRRPGAGGSERRELIMHGRAMSWIGVGLVLAAGVAAAQTFDVPQGRWWERPAVAGRLGLTPDQVKGLDAATLAFARRMVDLKATVEKAAIDLRAASDAEPFAPDKVREAFAVLQQARGRLETERFDMLLKVRELLTAEQWGKLQELARARRAEKGDGAQPAAPGDRTQSVRRQTNAPPTARSTRDVAAGARARDPTGKGGRHEESLARSRGACAGRAGARG